MRERYYFIYRLRGWLMVPLFVFIYLCRWCEIESDYLIFPLGVFIFLSGLSLRIWAQMHLHYCLRNRMILTITGPYNFVRNPVYIGNILVFLGVTVLCEILYFVPVVLVYCAVVYAFVVQYEEVHMLNKYKIDYERYFKTVPRWLPRFLGFINTQKFEVKHFLFPSIMVELRCLLLLFIPILKELADPQNAVH